MQFLRIPRAPSGETQGCHSCSHPVTWFAMESPAQPLSCGDRITLTSLPASEEPPSHPCTLQSPTHRNETTFLLSYFEIEILPTGVVCVLYLCIIKNLILIIIKKLATT